MFNWKDILITKNAIKNAVNEGFALMDPFFAHLNNTVQHTLDGVADRINSAIESLKSTSRDSVGSTSNALKNQNSANYAMTQKCNNKNIFQNHTYNHKSSVAVDGDEADSDVSTALKSATDPLTEALAQFSKLFEGLSGFDDFVDFLERQASAILHHPDQIITLTFDIILEALQLLVSSTLKIVGNLFSLIINAISGLISTVKSVLNKEIKIPLLSSLYKMISGSKLTLLDLMSMIIAIPATIFYKLVRNKAPLTEQQLAEFKSDLSATKLMQLITSHSAQNKENGADGEEGTLKSSSAVSENTADLLGVFTGCGLVACGGLAAYLDTQTAGNKPSSRSVLALRFGSSLFLFFVSCPWWAKVGHSPSELNWSLPGSIGLITDAVMVVMPSTKYELFPRTLVAICAIAFSSWATHESHHDAVTDALHSANIFYGIGCAAQLPLMMANSNKYAYYLSLGGDGLIVMSGCIVSLTVTFS